MGSKVKIPRGSKNTLRKKKDTNKFPFQSSQRWMQDKGKRSVQEDQVNLQNSIIILYSFIKLVLLQPENQNLPQVKIYPAGSIIMQKLTVSWKDEKILIFSSKSSKLFKIAWQFLRKNLSNRTTENNHSQHSRVKIHRQSAINHQVEWPTSEFENWTSCGPVWISIDPLPNSTSSSPSSPGTEPPWKNVPKTIEAVWRTLRYTQIVRWILDFPVPVHSIVRNMGNVAWIGSFPWMRHN